MKKFAALGLALVMCLALMIPAIATEETFETENSALVPTVEVELPSSGVVILNPYKMAYTGSVSGITTGASDQILSNLFSLTNKTQNTKLKVSVAFTGVVAGNAELETAAAFGNDETGNKVILNLTCGLTNTAGAAPTTMPSVKNTKQVTDAEQTFGGTNGVVLNPATASGNTYLSFQFSGSAVTTPETPWSENDTVGATFVFTFEPTTADATASTSVAS